MNKYDKAKPIDPEKPIAGGGRPSPMGFWDWCGWVLQPLQVEDLMKKYNHRRYYKEYGGRYYLISMIYGKERALSVSEK